jgi:hypothetical protein
MGSFFLLAAVVVAICMTGFGIVVYTVGRTSGLSLPNPDGRVIQHLSPGNADRPDVTVKFPRALLGYEKSTVDAVVNRLGTELAAAAFRIAELSSTTNEARDIRGCAAKASADTEELPR